MTTEDGVDSDLVIPDSFGECLSYEQQIAFILKLIDDIDGGVVIPEITADATVDQSTGTPSVSVVKTGTDEAPVFTFNFHNIKGETGERGEKGDTGETGATGRPGNDGADGVSPTVTTTQIANGYRITITDADGSHVFDIYNGNDGDIGPAGYSPTVTVQTITGGHSVTITDEDGDHTFNVLDGLNGVDGDDGISPEVTISPITGGHRVTIVDVNGSHSFDVMDGQDGQAIPPVITAQATVGSGTGTPSVTVTKTGTDEAPTYTFAFDNLKGANGTDGVSPTITVTDHTTYHHIEITSAGGTEQFDVYNGTDGSDGTDGVSPTVTVRSITGGHQIEIVSAGGTERFDVMDGANGNDGSDGTDGVSPTVSTTAITDGTRVTITDAQGSHSFDVMNGADGTDGSDGQDGVAATIQVGTVTTGAAGTNASVTNSGTSSAAVFDFSIPRGADGQAGATGPAGSRGTGIYPISVKPISAVGMFGPYQIDYSDSPSSARPPINGDLYLYGSNLYKVTGILYDQSDNPIAVTLDNPISIATSDDLTLVCRLKRGGRNYIRIYKDNSNQPVFKFESETPMGEPTGGGFGISLADVWTAFLSIFGITSSNRNGYTLYDANDNAVTTFSDMITFLATQFSTLAVTTLSYMIFDDIVGKSITKTIYMFSETSFSYFTSIGETITSGSVFAMQMYQPLPRS